MRRLRMGLLITGGVLLGLLGLLAGCSLVDPLPSHSNTWLSPLQVVTPTPARAQLAVLAVQATPEIQGGIFTVTPLGETFLLVTATLQNTGSGALQLALAEVQLLDAAGRAFPRAQEAEFALRQGGAARTLSEQPLPPGAQQQVLLVFDVAAYTSPVQLQLRFAEGNITALPVEVRP